MPSGETGGGRTRRKVAGGGNSRQRIGVVAGGGFVRWGMGVAPVETPKGKGE